MDVNLFFALLGALLALAYIAYRLVRFTRVPDVIILMATGIVIGPVLGWVNPDRFRNVTPGLGSLALILILFEGGLDLKLREILRHFGAGFFLSLFSFVLCAAAVASACRFALHFGWIDCALIGSAMGCISSGTLLPVLQQIAIRREVRVTLLIEAAFGDVFAVLAVTTLLGLAAGANAGAKSVASSLAASLIIGVGCGILAGMLWSYLLPVLSEERFWNALTFAAVLLVYSGVHFIHGNDLVSVLVFGLTLANLPALRRKLADQEGAVDWFSETPVQDSASGTQDQRHHQLHSFHQELAFLLRTFFFVLLGMLADFAGLRHVLTIAALCFAAIVAARIVAVQAGRIAWREFTRSDRELMVWLVPRGLITAVLGIQVFESRGSAFDFLPSLAVAVVLLTNLLLVVGTFRSGRVAAAEPTVTGATAS